MAPTEQNAIRLRVAAERNPYPATDELRSLVSLQKTTLRSHWLRANARASAGVEESRYGGVCAATVNRGHRRAPNGRCVPETPLPYECGVPGDRRSCARNPPFLWVRAHLLLLLGVFESDRDG
jgi:hypothetical protein